MGAMSGRALWTAEAARIATGGRRGGEWSARRVSIDSRTVAPDDLFFAIAGPSHDGHDFVADALSRGAAGAVVSRQPEGVAAEAPLIRVDDTLGALERLGAERRESSAARIVAITGSAGKTSTKEALRQALAATAPTHASAASYNNLWGVPLSLARMPLDSAHGVFELGMNHPGEIAPLARQVRPHVALVTTIAPAHLAMFDDLAAIARAKAEIFQGLAPGGFALINRDAPHYEILAKAAAQAGAARIVGFGRDGAAESRLLKVVEHPHCICVSADVMGQAVAYKVGAPGRHWAMNSLAVLTVTRLLEADIGRAALALADVSALAGRGLRHEVETEAGAFVLIDESYNANPASMRAALAVLGATPPDAGGRRIAVLGDMLELGSEGPEFHAELAEPIAKAGIDLIFSCGPQMACLTAATEAEHRADAGELLALVLAEVRPGDVVMVKGSLGMAMAPIVEALRARGAASGLRSGGGRDAL